MSEAIHFTGIEIRRMPGFPDGGLTVEGFSAGINVVYGPNASGKSTLARAMQRVLRQQAPGRQTDSLKAALVFDSQSYDFDLHLGDRICSCGGTEIPVPMPLTTAEMGPWYVLALHELVRQLEDPDIIRQIIRESAGGYDLEAAADDLEFGRERPRGANISQHKECEAASRATREAERRLEGIAEEERGLGELRSRREVAHQAGRDQRQIEEALEVQAARVTRDQAQLFLDSFPPVLERMSGDEGRHLGKCKEKIQSLNEKRAACLREEETAREILQKQALPASGVRNGMIETHRTHAERLMEQQRDIDRLTGDRQAADKVLRSARERLGPDVLPEQIEQFDASVLGELFDFVRDAETHRLEQDAVEHQIRLMKETVSQIDSDPEILRDGVIKLEQWLAERHIRPVESHNYRQEWLWAAGITAGLGLGMALLFHWTWALLIPIGLGLVAQSLIASRPRVVTNRRDETIARQWSGTGLEQPAAWTNPEVQKTLHSLRKALAESQIQQQKSQVIAELSAKQEPLMQKRQELEQVRQEWHDRIGLTMDLDNVLVYMLAEEIARAQGAQSALTETFEKLSITQQQQLALLNRCRQELDPYVEWPEEISAGDISGLVLDLETRVKAHNDAHGRLLRAVSEREQDEESLVEYQAEAAAIFENLQLEDQDERSLNRYIEQYPGYKEASEALRLAEHDCESSLNRFSGSEAMLEMPVEQLEELLSEKRQLSEELTTIVEEYGNVVGRVEAAGKETHLEKALTEEQSCLETLEGVRDQDASELIGNVLVAHMRRQQHQGQQPGVLTRAQELFARITNGRYELEVQAGDPPSFRANDTSLGLNQQLEELSSGTRLQLLLAVRVAFAEQQEHGVQLPLIFDETLGNSDDRRAGKIIEAALEIARGGRQVFYLTAQHDELGKWRRVLAEEPDIPNCEFDLARLRGFSEVEYAPGEVALEEVPRDAIAEPESDDWTDYVTRLKIPELDRRSHIGGVHIGYVVFDVQDLHRLLKSDINKWGQLQALVETGAPGDLTSDSDLYLRAEAAARLLEELQRLWLIGRGEPIDRSTLEVSGAVSATFIEAVSELNESLEGDARGLIDALRDGRVPRFRTDKMDSLENYLSENGFLDDQEVLDQDAIREAVMPRVFTDCEKGFLSDPQIDLLIGLITREGHEVEEVADSD